MNAAAPWLLPTNGRITVTVKPGIGAYTRFRTLPAPRPQSGKAMCSQAFHFCSSAKAISSLPTNWRRFPTICPPSGGPSLSKRVVIVDRGPYGRNRRVAAIIDLSPAAAEKLGIIKRGHARVKLEVLLWGNG